MHFVIVGGGIAGVSALEHLCLLATTSTPSTSLASRSQVPSFLSDGAGDAVSITLVTPTPILKHITNVTHVSNNRATFDIESTPHAALLASLPTPHPPVTILLATLTQFDPLTRTLSLNPTSAAPVPATFTYDRLLLAVGASPAVPFSGRAVHVLRDVETVDEVQTAIAALPPVDSDSTDHDDPVLMVVGNGGIALEIVHALTSVPLQRRLVWVVKDGYMGNTFLDREASAYLLPLLFPTHDPAVDEKTYRDDEEKWAKTGGTRDVVADRPQDGESERVYGGGVGPYWQSRLHRQIPSSVGDTSTTSRAPANLTVHFNTIVLPTSAPPASSSTTALSVSLSNGLTYPVAHLLSATGVWPNTAFLTSSTVSAPALAVDSSDGGIVTDASTLCTSATDVWAAGDCTHMQWHSKDDSEMLQKRTWAQARIAGLNAAVSMWQNRQSQLSADGEADVDCVWYPLFTHTTQLFGQKVVLLGLYNETEYHKRRPHGNECSVCMRVRPVAADGTSGEYVKSVMEGGRVVGCTLIGDTDLEETMENLIVNRTDLSAYGNDWLHADIDLSDYFD